MNKYFEDYLSTLDEGMRDVACEAVREYLKTEGKHEKFDCAYKIYDLCRDMSLSDVEHSDILLLNQEYYLIKRVRVGTGGITGTIFDVRIILKHCLLNNATQVCLVHNHPSGGIHPSKPDDDVTMNIKKACEIMRIHFADHVIVGDGCYYSYNEQGRI